MATFKKKIEKSFPKKEPFDVGVGTLVVEDQMSFECPSDGCGILYATDGIYQGSNN